MKANRTTGEIELTKTTEFVFGEKIYLTGVDTKNGMSVQKELTVGQPKSLDTLEIQGFVKKGTTKLVTDLPAGFKAGEYYMVFEALDQNGNQYQTSSIVQEDITFISDNPLLISELKHDSANTTDVKTLVVDGVEMAAMLVQPGMNADKGGEVNLRAIANKTGKETVKNVVVGDLSILTTFDMLEPSDVIVEDEPVVIPFAAYDQNGEEITNFTTLAREAGINKLTLNSPQDGELRLTENNDGTAKLRYIPTNLGWTNGKTTDGVDRPISLTSVVVGGNASNLMLSVSDKARPVGIKSVEFDNTLVEQGNTTIKLSNDINNSFAFVDQYGREMKKAAANAFFAASNTLTSGQDFVDYEYYIRATYKGDSNLYEDVAVGNETEVKNDREFDIKVGQDLTLTTKANVTPTVKTGMALRFEIVKHKNATEGVLGVSPTKTESLSIVDITSVKNFEVKELPRLEVETINSHLPTGNTLTLTNGMAVTAGTGVDAAGNLTTPAKKEVKVTGEYNGKAVVVPGDYLKLESNQVEIDEDTKEITAIKDYVPAVAGTPEIPGVTPEAGEKQEVTITVTGPATETGDIIVKDQTVSITDADDADTIAAAINTALVGDANFDATVLDNVVTLVGKAEVANIDVTATGDVAGVTVEVKVTKDGKAPIGGTAPEDAKEGTPQEGFTWGDFYDAKTANFLRKDAKAIITAKVKDLDSVGTDGLDVIINTASRNVMLSDAKSVATTIKGPETLTVNAGITQISTDDIDAAIEAILVGDYKDLKEYTVLDQYGEKLTTDISYKAINVEENKDGYVNNNFKIAKNDTKDLAISGAERGDTFTLELRAGNAKLTVKVTVGADRTANIIDSDNNYLDLLIGNGKDGALENQRLDSLK